MLEPIQDLLFGSKTAASGRKTVNFFRCNINYLSKTLQLFTSKDDRFWTRKKNSDRFFKQIIINTAFIGLLSVGAAVASVTPSFAADCKENKPTAACCGTTETSIIGGDICKGVNSKSGSSQDSAVWKVLIFALKVMTAGVGILGVGGIAHGAILYTSAGDKADQTKKAIEIITNVVIGIVAYALMYVFLNFLIPGGVFV